MQLLNLFDVLHLNVVFSFDNLGALTAYFVPLEISVDRECLDIVVIYDIAIELGVFVALTVLALELKWLDFNGSPPLDAFLDCLL